jgi:hypothetical protein
LLFFELCNFFIEKFFLVGEEGSHVLVGLGVDGVEQGSYLAISIENGCLIIPELHAYERHL